MLEGGGGNTRLTVTDSAVDSFEDKVVLSKVLPLAGAGSLTATAAQEVHAQATHSLPPGPPLHAMASKYAREL